MDSIGERLDEKVEGAIQEVENGKFETSKL